MEAQDWSCIDDCEDVNESSVPICRVSWVKSRVVGKVVGKVKVVCKVVGHNMC